MKLLPALLLLIAPLCAETEQPTPPRSVYLETVLENIVAYDELATVLEPVKDISSARAAAPAVLEIVQSLVDLAGKSAALPQPTREEEEELREQLAEIDTATLSERAIGKILDLLTATDPPCYGSAELREALTPLVNMLMSEE